MTSAATLATVTMEERFAPSRPTRLGTRRRKPPQAVSVLPKAGASRFAERKAPSLDTCKQLATSCQNYLENRLTPYDDRRKQEFLYSQVRDSVWKIWQKHCRRPADDGDEAWWTLYEAARKPLDDESEADRWRRIEKWVKKNKPTGRNADILKWERQWARLDVCQKEWIGYKASCCGERSPMIAVPVGCNHRMCPLCAWHRTQVARVRIKSMYDRLEHPLLITLTTPNLPAIRKHDFTLFRQRVRALLAGYKGWIRGGVYSIETTYNRQAKTWHIHAHVLADASASLPHWSQKIDFAGQVDFAFMVIKLRMEFDWLRLWSRKWDRPPRANAKQMDFAGDSFLFEQWARQGHAHAVRKKIFDRELRRWTSIPLPGLSPEEFDRRTKWNQRNRRVVDVRRVKDRDGAAREVLKYITKGADFSDDFEAVEQFCDAVKGARLVQTFGTWYGAKLDTAFDPEHLDDWGEMKCACGLNMWERMGVFYRRDVAMNAEGRWFIRAPLNHQCRGTVPRPTIRALEAPEEMDTLCQMETR